MPTLSEVTNGTVEHLMPGATIGIIGGGQLGRMMALSARYMGCLLYTSPSPRDRG